MNPKNRLAYGIYGMVLLKLESYKEAVVAFDRAIELNPTHELMYELREAAKEALDRT